MDLKLLLILNKFLFKPFVKITKTFTQHHYASLCSEHKAFFKQGLHKKCELHIKWLGRLIMENFCSDDGFLCNLVVEVA